MDNESKDVVDLLFNDVRKMFDELLDKGYSVQEILNFPICVGNNSEKHFIKVTDRDNQFRVMLPISNILSIGELDGYCYIEFGNTFDDGVGSVVFTVESFDEISKLLI